MSGSTAAKAAAGLLQPATAHDFVNGVTRPHLYVWALATVGGRQQFLFTLLQRTPPQQQLDHSASQQLPHTLSIAHHAGRWRRYHRLPPLQGSVRYCRRDSSAAESALWRRIWPYSESVFQLFVLFGHWMSACQCPSALFVSAISRHTPVMEELIDTLFSPARTQT